MGQEIDCTARVGKKKSAGKALLETGYILFRGEFRVKIPFERMTSVQAANGWLEIVSSDGPLALQLGAAAPKWAQKILHPPSRLDKLGIKTGMRVVMVALKDDELAAEMASRGAEVRRRLTSGCDLILFGAEEKPALARLEALAGSIKLDGGIWVVYPKGIRAITENDVLAAIRAAGLVDVKVASFSPTHTALKAVIPKSRRL
jgi:hypothetical protein